MLFTVIFPLLRNALSNFDQNLPVVYECINYNLVMQISQTIIFIYIYLQQFFTCRKLAISQKEYKWVYSNLFRVSTEKIINQNIFPLAVLFSKDTEHKLVVMCCVSMVIDFSFSFKIYLLIYFFRTLNSLYDPAIQTKLHPGFLVIKDISESDKNFILGKLLQLHFS